MIAKLTFHIQPKIGNRVKKNLFLTFLLFGIIILTYNYNNLLNPGGISHLTVKKSSNKELKISKKKKSSNFVCGLQIELV